MSLNKEEITDLLNKEKVCFITTTKHDGSPHKEMSWHYADQDWE